MKKLLLFLVTAMLLFSCVSSKKHMIKGQYDWAINKSVKKLRKNPKKEKEILVLEQSYNKAMQQDKEQVEFLTKEGNPDRWNEVHDLYFRMKSRQTKVRSLNLPLTIASTGRKVDFAFVNYDDEIIESKKKAAEYFYVHGVTLLEKKDRFSARSAYNDFMMVKRFYPEYKDLDAKMQQALNQGTSHVLFKMQNRANAVLPATFEQELLKIAMADLNGQWVNYHTREEKNTFYDYTIIANINMIDVSPEAVKEVHYSETKEIPDGFTYVLDKKGNVMKDSLGDDIKLPKTKIIKCDLHEVQQRKSARIGGTLDFFDNQTKQLIKSDPIGAENHFENIATKARGDLNALKPETKARLGNAPQPFPPTFDMLYQCGLTLKGISKDIIYGNRGLLK